jgi:subtilisin family serine protease
VNVCLPVTTEPTWALFPTPTVQSEQLLADDGYRDFLRSIGVDPAASPTIVTLSTLREAPPRYQPFFNDYINVLTVPAPDLETITRLLNGGVPDGTTIEAAVEYGVPVPRPFEGSDCSGDVERELVPAGVRLIDAPDVWRMGITGRSVSVAIVDTGVTGHSDLPAPTAAMSFVPGVSSCDDENGHGTFVAGIALARFNKRELVGVSHAADLIVARVTGADGKAPDCWIAAGITWSAATGADVINVCVVGFKASEVMRQAVRVAVGKGAVICAAAGNNHSTARLAFPAAYPESISVGATRFNDTRCTESNWTQEMTIGAPGCPILSLGRNGGPVCEHGTSAATPHVSGIVALMLEKDSCLQLEEIRRRLQESGEIVSNGGKVRRASALGSVTDVKTRASAPNDRETRSRTTF